MNESNELDREGGVGLTSGVVVQLMCCMNIYMYAGSNAFSPANVSGISCFFLVSQLVFR